MPVVGNRKQAVTMGKGYANDPISAFAASFQETAQNILQESGFDIFSEPSKAVMVGASYDTLKNFFVEGSADPAGMTAEEYQDHIEMMNEQFENDREAMLEHANVGSFNPVMGLAFPLHKNILMNNVFDKGAIPKVVAKEPKFTITMENRILVDTEGNEIDMFLEQNKMMDAIDGAAPFVDCEYKLPLTEEASADASTGLMAKLGGIDKVDHLSIETYISAVKVGGTWYNVNARFTPAYGDYDRTIMQQVNVNTGAAVVTDVLAGYMKNDKICLTSTSGKVTDVRISARLDTSSANLDTCSVKWTARTDIVEIPSAIPINTTISPEEVKDVGALYQVNHLSKIMSLFKLAIGNYKDDKIKHHLDSSFLTMPATNKLSATFDFAPREGYALDHVEWRQKTFMDALDTHVSNLLQVLNDPNMTITVFGRPDLIRKITPTEYTYQTPGNIGPVELDFVKTVTTSDKRTYQFIASDKLRGNNNLIIILCPRNTERIVYRIYDYQMYVSNEIRNAKNPALPAIHAFERWKFVEYQPVQGRIKVLNPTGLTTAVENDDPIGTFAMNDFNSNAPTGATNPLNVNVVGGDAAEGGDDVVEGE